VTGCREALRGEKLKLEKLRPAEEPDAPFRLPLAHLCFFARTAEE